MPAGVLPQRAHFARLAFHVPHSIAAINHNCVSSCTGRRFNPANTGIARLFWSFSSDCPVTFHASGVRTSQDGGYHCLKAYACSKSAQSIAEITLAHESRNRSTHWISRSKVRRECDLRRDNASSKLRRSSKSRASSFREGRTSDQRQLRPQPRQ